jgi:competence protein ComEC
VTTNADDRNDYSTVLSVKYKNFSTLLTGDISTEMENQLQDMLASHYTILKVAHHGSKYSTSKNFLQWIKPDYSVISVGANNMYGHPSAETLERLTQSESRILRTDESGGITVWSDGEQMGIEKMIE